MLTVGRLLAVSSAKARFVLAPVSTIPQTCSVRTIFSDEFLGVDLFMRQKNRFRLASRDEDMFKEQVRSSFADSGLKNIFSEDIRRLINAADNEEDVALVRDILKELLQNSSSRPLPLLPKFLDWYFVLCKHNNFLGLASDIWDEPKLATSGYREQWGVKFRYLAQLFENEMYQDVVDLVSQNPCLSAEDATLAMASLYKLGTDEAFEKASETLQNLPKQLNRKWKRSIQIYSLFALSRGECGLAYDVLNDSSDTASRRDTNLKLAILTEVGRLEEAIELIQSDMNHLRGKMLLSFEVMHKLANAIKEKYPPSSDVAKEFSSMCKILDDTALLEEVTVGEMVMGSIKTSKKTLRLRDKFREKAENE